MQRAPKVYIIHIEAPEGWTSHYVGYTTRRLLSKRLEEHRNNPRQMERREAIRQARLVKIVTIDERGDLQKERYYQQFSERLLTDHVCPICRLFRAAGFEIENEQTLEGLPAFFPAKGNQSNPSGGPSGDGGGLDEQMW